MLNNGSPKIEDKVKTKKTQKNLVHTQEEKQKVKKQILKKRIYSHAYYETHKEEKKAYCQAHKERKKIYDHSRYLAKKEMKRKEKEENPHNNNIVQKKIDWREEQPLAQHTRFFASEADLNKHSINNNPENQSLEKMRISFLLNP